MHRLDGVIDLAEETGAHRRGIQVLPGQELLLWDPHALDEVERSVPVRPVVSGKLRVEAGPQNGIDTDRAEPEGRHLGEPAAVVCGARRQLAGQRARDRGTEVDTG